MNKDFELIGYTADVGIRATGTDLARAFCHAADGMFSLITDREKIEEAGSCDISVDASDRESLLVAWLNELVFLFETEQWLFKRYHIDELTENSLKARCYGEKIDKSRHDLKREIKSATYHRLKIEKMPDGGYEARVLLDI
ncbi:MAG: archease [Dehalococcoidales bacterium]|nr:archease [Dehalococcoidales bacterium]